QSGKTLPISFGADGGEVVWNGTTSAGILGIEGGPASISFEIVDSATTSVLVIKQDQGDPANPVTVAEVTLTKATGAYSYVQVANLLHVDNGDNVEDDATFVLGYTVTDGDGDTVDGSIDLIIDDDTPIIEAHSRADYRIISDDDDVTGLNGNPGFGDNPVDGTPSDSREYHQSGKTLPISFGADGGEVVWNGTTSAGILGIEGGPASISFEIVDSATTSVLVIKQDQGDP
ncbi:hypothetical protein, partial [Labrenzia sp. OB1]|uniref:hypothetical protein n=1 Tax=Labrenzia sp. OB1 TaxID=1561204 RepID=UPI0007B2CB3C